MDKKKFPKNFIFGTAVASYQVEGGIYNNDWTIWENNKNSKCEELCGEACKHYELVNEDIKLLKNLGIRAFRFSIEWSRIQPKKNKYRKISKCFITICIVSNCIFNSCKY